MTITQLKAAIQTALTAAGVSGDFFMDDRGIVNSKKQITYPAAWMPPPTSTMLFNKRGYEDFSINIGLYNTRNQKTEAQILTEMDTLADYMHKTIRDLHTDNTDIVGFKSNVVLNKFTHLFNDRNVGVEASFTLEIWTGWDCNA